MKTRFATLLSLLLVLATAAHAAPAKSPQSPYGFNVDAVRLPYQAELTDGATQLTVLMRLGTPQRKLSPDVWVYPGFYPAVPEGQSDRGCDTLVVTFTDGRVTDLKIMNHSATVVVAANLKKMSETTLVAKK